jgi:hypothetical protein
MSRIKEHLARLAAEAGMEVDQYLISIAYHEPDDLDDLDDLDEEDLEDDDEEDDLILITELFGD